MDNIRRENDHDFIAHYVYAYVDFGCLVLWHILVWIGGIFIFGIIDSRRRIEQAVSHFHGAKPLHSAAMPALTTAGCCVSTFTPRIRTAMTVKDVPCSTRGSYFHMSSSNTLAGSALTTEGHNARSCDRRRRESRPGGQSCKPLFV